MKPKSKPSKKKSAPKVKPVASTATLFGQIVRKQRFEHDDMGQKELGAIVGVSRQSVAAWEKGACTPNLTVARHVALTLSFSLDTFTPLP